MNSKNLFDIAYNNNIMVYDDQALSGFLTRRLLSLSQMGWYQYNFIKHPFSQKKNINKVDTLYLPSTYILEEPKEYTYEESLHDFLYASNIHVKYYDEEILIDSGATPVGTYAHNHLHNDKFLGLLTSQYTNTYPDKSVLLISF